MIRSGRSDHFRLVQQFLRDRFSAEIVAAALGVPSVADFASRDPEHRVRDPLTRLLFAGAAVPVADLRPVMPLPVLEAFGALGLLEFADDQRRHVWCTVVLYPFGLLHLVSDRLVLPDGSPVSDPEFVYLALTPNTQRFLHTLPDHACGSFLDLGAGCGAAALAQAAIARRAVASDVSPRASLFAEFNRRLNDIPNVEVVTGSVYDAVRGQRFDRIGCHPPYDLSPAAKWTFADGGDDGEFVIRSAVQGLPEHLAAGGEFIAQFRAADCTGAPLEQRVRSWIGPENSAEFDVALIVRETGSVHEHVFDAVAKAGGDMQMYRSLVQWFSERAVEQLVYCSILVRRKMFASAPVTVRRLAGKKCEYDELRWALDCEQLAGTIGLESAVLRLSPSAEVVVRHRVSQSGELHPADYTIVASTPFRDELASSQWLALLISEFDGRRSVGTVFERMRRNGPVEPAQFKAALHRLIAMGVLQLASGSRITSSS